MAVGSYTESGQFVLVMEWVSKQGNLKRGEAHLALSLIDPGLHLSSGQCKHPAAVRLSAFFLLGIPCPTKSTKPTRSFYSSHLNKKSQAKPFISEPAIEDWESLCFDDAISL